MHWPKRSSSQVSLLCSAITISWNYTLLSHAFSLLSTVFSSAVSKHAFFLWSASPPDAGSPQAPCVWTISASTGNAPFWQLLSDPIFFKCCFFIFPGRQHQFRSAICGRRPSSFLPGTRVLFVVPPLVLLLRTGVLTRHSSERWPRTLFLAWETYCHTISIHEEWQLITTSVPGFATFSPVNMDVRLNEQSSMEYKLLPIGRYENVTQHLWLNHFSSCVSLNGLECKVSCDKNPDNTGILSCCSLFRWSWSNQSLSVKLLPPSLRNLNLGFGYLNFECIAPSVSLSRGFSCRKSLLTKFRDLGFTLVPKTEFFGGQVLPNSFVKKNAVIWPFTLGMLLIMILHVFLSNFFKKIFWFSVS